MHRNSFLNSPQLLSGSFRLKKQPDYWFAGQMTGVEGYMESAASGLLAGLNCARAIGGREEFVPPPETMLGALCRHVSESASADFQPMGANFGILPPLAEQIRDKKERYGALAHRALCSLQAAMSEK